MPKRNSINLKDLCFQVICHEMEILKHHLTCLLYSLITELYERQDYFGLDVEKLPLEIFLNVKLTKLIIQDILRMPRHTLTDEMDNFYKIFHQRTDECIQRVCESCLVNNITHIKLSHCKSVKPSLQVKLIQHFNQIQILEIDGLANDELLTAIGTHCPQLRYLNARTSKRVTDKGIESLCINKEMKIVHLNISDTKVTAKGCLCAFKNLKCLKIFLQYCCNEYCWNELFEMLKLEMHSTPAYSSIEEIGWHRYLNEEKLMIATVAFPNLRTLKVDQINLNHIVVRNYLEKVTDLTVYNENIDINLVGLCCPVLEALELHITNFTNLQNDSSIPNRTPFKHLQSLKLDCLGNDIPKNDLSLLLANCDNLHKLSFEKCQTLTDDFFMNMIKVNPLYHLREIRIYFCDHISVISLMSMLQMDNFLNDIIIMDCALLNEFETTQLKSYVKTNHLNVKVGLLVIGDEIIDDDVIDDDDLL